MSTQVDLFTTVEPTSVSPAIAKLPVSRSTFYQGDCLVEMDKIADNSVDLVCTDPPYKVTSGGNVPTGFINGHWRLKNGEANPQAKSGKIFKENEIKFSDWMPEIYRVLKQQTHFYCMTNDLHLKTVIEEGIKSGFKRWSI